MSTTTICHTFLDLPSLRVLLALLPLLAASRTASAARPSASEALPDRVQFNRDIRPILADNCFACHGPDKNKRQADLRLDTEQGLRGENGPLVIGQPDDSPLWRRITSDDAETIMPPPATGKRLSPRDRELIRRWIEQGAAWEGHWAFNPIVRPELPPGVADRGTTANPVDQFVAAKRREASLTAAPRADRRTLIRRVTLDLTGLPPTGGEVDAFVADNEPDAFERVVDRLLASPRYGERMAMWWLDLVRYADSVGYHGDQPVSVWPYRQYVIDAFNANLPFDRFTVEQLAGDLLPQPSREQKIASGYNRLGMMSAEGGVQDKEYLAKYIAERVRNLSGAWLGVTMGCCECHDHKYDPFTSRDFYRLEAFFADVQEKGFYANANATGEWGPRMQVPSLEQEARQAMLGTRQAELEAQIHAETPELAAAQAKWEAELQAWTVLKPTEMSSAGGASLRMLDDGSILVSGDKPEKDTTTLTFAAPPAGLTALRLEVLPDNSLPSKGPGRADNGNFVLSEIRATMLAANDAEPQPVAWRHALATFEQYQFADKTTLGRWVARYAIDGDIDGPDQGWAVLERVGQPNVAQFMIGPNPLPGGEGVTLTVALEQRLGDHHTLGRFRLAGNTAPQDPLGTIAPLPTAEVANDLVVPVEQRTAEQRARIRAYFREVTPLLAAEREQLGKVRQQLEGLDKAIPTTLVTVSGPPRTVRVQARGNWMDDSGEEMSPGVPGVLPQLTAGDARPSRLDLAQWLVAPDNPLTARATANRLWKLMFGVGLSRRLDDLGAQGQWPTHPELLDWLAYELRDHGWDFKRLLRLMVTSSAYQQASRATPDDMERDPENIFLARQNRYRLDAELVRDHALLVSGMLVERVGGPSVHPYQPPGYWAHLNFPMREWETGQGAALYRRGLYTHWQRQYLHPALLAFDAPNREECTADRPRSNTPLQALVLLNDTSHVEAARAFAQRVLAEAVGGDVTLSTDGKLAARLEWAFRQALGRPIVPAERQVLATLLARQRAQFHSDPAAAAELLHVGQWKVGADADPVELAAWTGVCRVIFNLHETVTRN